MARWLVIFVLAIQPLFFPIGEGGQVEFSNEVVSYQFGESIRFEAIVKTDEKIQEALIFIQPVGGTTRLGNVIHNDQGELRFAYDIAKDPQAPFSQMVYWYRIILQNGEEIESSKYTFEYIDNRFEWLSLKDDLFEVYWYDMDYSIGQSILNVAHQGLDASIKIIDVSLQGPVKIYAYSNTEDLQSALQVGQKNWVAGNAYPEEKTILLSIPSGPSQRLEMERQIPHEIIHILEYQLTGRDYDLVPAWLREGMASQAELYPNADYRTAILEAVTENRLLSLSSLCGSFPSDASGAFLAYAESDSFVQFLHDKFGTSGLQKMIRKYQDGLGCEEGASEATGMTLSQLEYQWQKETLGIHAETYVLQNLYPYIAIFVLIVGIPLFSVIPGVKRKKK